MTIFETLYKTYEYELLSCATCITLMYSKLWNIASLMFNKQKVVLKEWNMNLIYCVMDFLESQKLNYLKFLLRIKNDYFNELSFCEIFKMHDNIIIWNQKWKKLLISNTCKFSYFNVIFKYTRYGISKWFSMAIN